MTTTINGSPLSNQSLQVSNQRPTTLTLVHVRLPPGFTPSNLNRPMNVHSAHHNAGKVSIINCYKSYGIIDELKSLTIFYSGTLLLASSNGDDDILWCIGRDYFLFESTITETQVSHQSFLASCFLFVWDLFFTVSAFISSDHAIIRRKSLVHYRST